MHVLLLLLLLVVYARVAIAVLACDVDNTIPNPYSFFYLPSYQ